MDSQPRLFVPATMTFVLAFVVKLLASEFVNVFENLPCVVGFLLTRAGSWMGKEKDVVPKLGTPNSAGVPSDGWGAVPGAGEGSACLQHSSEIQGVEKEGSACVQHSSEVPTG